MQLAGFSAGGYRRYLREGWNRKNGYFEQRRHGRRNLRGRLIAGIAMLQAGIRVGLRSARHGVVTILYRHAGFKRHSGRCACRYANLGDCHSLRK